MWLNLGCGPHSAPAPWVNADVVSNESTHPDVVVSIECPFQGFTECQRIYMGHVLEHVPWERVVPLLVEARHLLAPGGELLVVGPDVERAIRHFKDDLVPWELVQACLESACSYQIHVGDVPGARHQWNCTEARVASALNAAGFTNVTCLAITPEALAGWPIVSYIAQQMAVLAS